MQIHRKKITGKIIQNRGEFTLETISTDRSEKYHRLNNY